MGIVIGISGAAGAGKDTVADFLISERGWVEKMSFARNLKDMCKVIFFLSEEQVNEQVGKMTPFSSPIIFSGRNLGSVMYWMSLTHAACPVLPELRDKVRSLIGTELVNPRHVLQFVGTNICRELVPTYHLDIVAQKIEESTNDNIIITDVRFPNEADLVLDVFQGLVVYLSRPNYSVNNIDKSHTSEVALSDWGRFSATISNHREGLPFLYEEVDNFLRKSGLCQMIIP